jgi:hypothetical protein
MHTIFNGTVKGQHLKDFETLNFVFFCKIGLSIIQKRKDDDPKREKL